LKALIQGLSMHPTLPAGTRVRVNCGTSPVTRGDVVAAVSGGQLVAHRVVHVGRSGEAARFVITQGDGRTLADPPLERAAIMGVLAAAELGSDWVPIPPAPGRSWVSGSLARGHARLLSMALELNVSLAGTLGALAPAGKRGALRLHAALGRWGRLPLGRWSRPLTCRGPGPAFLRTGPPPLAIERIDHVNMSVDDLAASVAFPIARLWLRAEGGRVARADTLGDRRLRGRLPVPVRAPRCAPPKEGPVHRALRLRAPPDAFDAAHRALREMGVALQFDGPVTWPRSCPYVLDPSGHVIELAERVGGGLDSP
jgi:catechol 2,3-dioxygenase-like lactoylglutathione lyase family enzyme